MGKDLRTTPVSLKLHRLPKLDGTAWNLRSPQPFFPSLEKLFKTDTLSGLHDYGIKLKYPIESIVDADTISTGGRKVKVHRKTTMILSPFKTMRGDYGDVSVPKRSEIASDLRDRMQSAHTAAYVGALTSIALSESECQNFPRVYGVYVGVATTHTIDISDDYEDLTERSWFAENIGKTFTLRMRTGERDAEFTHSRANRGVLLTGEDIDLGEIEELSPDHVSSASSRSVSDEQIEEEEEDEEDDESEDEDVYEIESCDCGSVEGDEEEGDEEESEPFAWATFTDVPVVTTAMEVCEGTFYDLLKIHTEPEKHCAWVSQVVFALAYAQRNYGLTHNDLHGNNVMYVKTDQTHLIYNHAGTYYRVPTFGYVMKIIDFDRAILSLKLTGMKEPKMFMSNQFHEDEEAGGQYNMDPFYNQKYPHLSASPSFDLTRFATSLFWEMFPKGPDHEYTHPLVETFKQWMTQSDGSSVMFRKQKDNHDRYHGFDLYKAIARYCRESAVPKKEIAKLTAYKANPSAAQMGDALFIES